MNKLKAAHALCKAKARQLCFLVLLCFHLASGDVPGPCKHSVTNDHIQIVNTLIVNQLENGCSIEYKFIDQGSLSKTCYVKAAFPKVLDVLTKHFNYHKSSVNFKYVDELKTLVKNIYRTKCILEVNVSMEDDPEKFVKAYAGSPAAVLGHIRKVMSFYMELLTENSRPINWSCADQYAQDVAELTTEGTLPTGTTAYQCSCPAVGGSAAKSASTTAINFWKNLPNPTVDIPNTPYSTELPPPKTGSPSAREGWGIPSANPGTTRSYRHRTIDTDTTSGASINNFQTSSEKNPTSPSFTSIPNISPQDEDNTGSPTSEYTPTSSEAQGDVSQSSPGSQTAKPFSKSLVHSQTTDQALSGQELLTAPLKKRFTPSTKRSMDHLITFIPPYDSTTPTESSAISPRAKRSVDPRVDGSFDSSESELHRDWTPVPIEPLGFTDDAADESSSSVLLHRKTHIRIHDNENINTGYGSKILGHGEGEIQPSDGPRGGRQSEKESQYETQNPYKQLFISAAVCGGLLGICAIYCFIQKKELQARLHKQEQDEKLKQHSHCLEMEESTLLKRQCSAL
ncbi:uncharacterized protein LOC121304734 isoform X2 [Polyodon spathula]|uniref:uncharacterized protein LOC121304734 isoform X2 n=1 Tax=Polyodon spathula TaxID=7913 RepID=UPI001B7E0993|nr:uncharacterized protein LOC121304734 isoform X2 [Polyodon spathula]